MTITEFNRQNKTEAISTLLKCCGSYYWAEKLADERPFTSTDEIIIESDRIWETVSKEDILEAFRHHPKIGDLKSLEEKFASTKNWAAGEQSGINAADPQILTQLAKGNAEYEQKFGYIFIVCATGKSANEMLELLQERFPHDPSSELKVAAKEQNKITHIRLKKLFQ